MSQEVKVYYENPEAMYDREDRRISQWWQPFVLKSDYDRVTKELDESNRWRDEAKNWNKVL